MSTVFGERVRCGSYIAMKSINYSVNGVSDKLLVCITLSRIHCFFWGQVEALSKNLNLNGYLFFPSLSQRTAP